MARVVRRCCLDRWIASGWGPAQADSGNRVALSCGATGTVQYSTVMAVQERMGMEMGMGSGPWGMGDY